MEMNETDAIFPFILKMIKCTIWDLEVHSLGHAKLPIAFVLLKHRTIQSGSEEGKIILTACQNVIGTRHKVTKSVPRRNWKPYLTHIINRL